MLLKFGTQVSNALKITLGKFHQHLSTASQVLKGWDDKRQRLTTRSVLCYSPRCKLTVEDKNNENYLRRLWGAAQVLPEHCWRVWRGLVLDDAVSILKRLPVICLKFQSAGLVAWSLILLRTPIWVVIIVVVWIISVYRYKMKEKKQFFLFLLFLYINKTHYQNINIYKKIIVIKLKSSFSERQLLRRRRHCCCCWRAFPFGQRRLQMRDSSQMLLTRKRCRRWSNPIVVSTGT